MDDTESLIKLKDPLNCILAGNSGSGKTSLTFEILKHSKGIFTTEPKKFIYCYGVYQRLYDDMKATIPHIEFLRDCQLKKISINGATKLRSIKF